jgi:hypothetical protein
MARKPNNTIGTADEFSQFWRPRRLMDLPAEPWQAWLMPVR